MTATRQKAQAQPCQRNASLMGVNSSNPLYFSVCGICATQALLSSAFHTSPRLGCRLCVVVRLHPERRRQACRSRVRDTQIRMAIRSAIRDNVSSSLSTSRCSQPPLPCSCSSLLYALTKAESFKTQAKMYTELMTILSCSATTRDRNVLFLAITLRVTFHTFFGLACSACQPLLSSQNCLPCRLCNNTQSSLPLLLPLSILLSRL